MVILAAIDENERSKQVATVAADLARTYDDTLIALHVVPKDEYRAHKESLRDIPGFGDFSLTKEAESAKRFAREFVLDTVDDLDDDRFEARGRVGDVSTEILSTAETIEPRFLVISGRRRSPTGKAIFGNTAQQILLNAECPVVSKLSDD